MKVSRHRKNRRHQLAGTTPNTAYPTPAHDLSVFDPDQFVLETMTALKELPPHKLLPDLRTQVEAWTPPRFQCPGCLRGGLLSQAIREPKVQWRCPGCHQPVNHDPVS